MTSLISLNTKDNNVDLHQKFENSSPKSKQLNHSQLNSNVSCAKDSVSFKSHKTEDKKNIWHTYPLKACAYSNDVGEALRPLAGSLLAKLSWIPAITYVGGSILSKAVAPPSENKYKEITKETVFQIITSLALPIILIKCAGKATRKVMEKLPKYRKSLMRNKPANLGYLKNLLIKIKPATIKKYGSVCESVVGLATLAAAVKPVDKLTEKALDKIYGDK